LDTLNHKNTRPIRA